MPKGRVPARQVICKACDQPFVSDKVGKAAQLCHTASCDEARARARRIQRDNAKAVRAAGRRQETVERRAERELQRRLAREERDRQRKAARIAENRRKAAEKKARKKGLEIFAPIMDDPDQMKMVADILEICELSSGVADPSWVELRKAITRVALAKPDGREASHAALQRLSAVAMRMADAMRVHAVRDPKAEEALEAADEEPELVAA